MARNFKSSDRWPAANGQWNWKLVVRAVLGSLLAANVAALGLVFWPIGGSAADLERQLGELRAQVLARQAQLERSRMIASKVEKGREEAERFLNQYFLSRRSAYSAILSELVTAAKESKITPREHAYATEPIEGSDTLSMMTITANYDGTYADLMHFVKLLDRSQRLVIIESLNAAPQQEKGRLNVSMKLDTFVREAPLAAEQATGGGTAQ